MRVMKTLRYIAPLMLLVLTTGCIDDRMKRLSSLNDVKTQTAREEFEAAKTDAEKVQIAREYFRNAPEIARTINDYMHGRKPADLPVTPAAETVPLPPN